MVGFYAGEESMNARGWLTWGTLSLAAAGAAMAAKSFFPLWLGAEPWYGENRKETRFEPADFPAIEVSFLRCGSTMPIPDFIMMRGAASLATRRNAHSAVLIRHPKATFLYDTGLSNDIFLSLVEKPLFFRKTLANFTLERAIGNHLQQLALRPSDLKFALISHLHWDHVSGVPDLPGVPLLMNRVEYDAAQEKLLDAFGGVTRELIGQSNKEFFDLAGPAYEGFRASHDLLGDGSLVLVPLPGHTAGNTGMFINRSNGPRVLLIGDAAWVAENYLYPTPMHSLMWSRVTSDQATALQTLIDLHRFALKHPEIPIIAMHDAHMQEAFMRSEQFRIPPMKVS